MTKTFTILDLEITQNGTLLHGRTTVNEQSIEAEADDIQVLKERMKLLIYEFEGFRIDGFRVETR